MIKKSFVLVFVLLAQFVSAEPDTTSLLKNMVTAARLNNYQANLVVFENGDLSSLAIEHRARNGDAREWERLVSLQGAKQETVLHGSKMLLLLPNGKKELVLRNPLADTFLNLRHSLQKYTIDLIGEDRVASRPTYVLRIQAKDKYHYSYLLWLDKATGIYLRAKWLDDDGQTKSEAMLTSIKFYPMKNNLARANQLANTKSTQLLSEKINKKTIGGNMVKVGWLPEGFSLLNKLIHPPEGPGQTEHLVFGDGMVKVSVYIETANQLVVDGAFDLGRTCGFGLDLDEKHITVLGEMPVLTLEKIAKSIAHK